MLPAAIALHVGLASSEVAGAADELAKGKAVVTRLGRPFCADPLDLQSYLAATESGAEAVQAYVGSCAPLQARHPAVIIKALPRLGIVNVRVRIGQRSVAGYMTTAGIRAP